uniref:Inositol-1-monophosphatase n=1 Tax=Lutzomyia longipalpis TaxID=7200 RepID=A0A7G3AQ61_LUTLO
MSGAGDFSEDSALKECQDFMCEVIEKAGDIVRRGIDAVKKVETKTSVFDLVTEYDGEVEDFLVAEIHRKYPDHKIIAEEKHAKEALTDDPTGVMSGAGDFCEDSVLKECQDFMCEVIEKAGDIVRRGIDAVKKVETKTSVFDLVTEYDGEVEDFLVAEIHRKYPDHKIIAEEKHAKEALTDDPTWIIDPIDGTTSFVHGYPLVAISVALAFQKRLVLGVVSAPIQRELYCARRGHGATMNGQKIHTTSTTSLIDSLVGDEPSLASRDKYRNEILVRTYGLTSRVSGIRAVGSAVLGLVYVARGILDVYQVEGIYPWDLAAGAIIVQEAGGVISHPDGSPYDIMNGSIVVAANEELHKQILAFNQEFSGKVLELRDK